MTKQEKMEEQMKKFNTLIKKGYKVNWKETKQKGNKTMIVLEKTK